MKPRCRPQSGSWLPPDGRQSANWLVLLEHHPPGTSSRSTPAGTARHLRSNSRGSSSARLSNALTRNQLSRVMRAHWRTSHAQSQKRTLERLRFLPKIKGFGAPFVRLAKLEIAEAKRLDVPGPLHQPHPDDIAIKDGEQVGYRSGGPGCDEAAGRAPCLQGSDPLAGTGRACSQTENQNRALELTLRRMKVRACRNENC